MSIPSDQKTFTHLHLHSQYSLLDGAIRLRDLFPRLHEMGMESVALTDHGNMFGALDFYKSARKHGIKPIFGCEVYISDGPMAGRSVRKNYHFILLAKNMEGYRNLVHLVSKGYLEGFYYHPRIDKALLKRHRGGLIGLSACLGGEVAQTILRGGTEQGRATIQEYRDLFEPGCFYLEVQPNGLTEQNEVNETLGKMAASLDLPLVATNDCHYLDRKDARAHDCLMCVQTGKLLSDRDRIKHDIDEYYLKSPQEMESAFHHIPQAIENTIKIANMCNVELDLNQTHLPRYSVPDGYDLKRFLEHQTFSGLDARLGEYRAQGREVDRKAYRDRVAHELDVVESMGFSSYFLIVWDFIRHAKSKHIPVGPGRGSGAGSLVAYALRITDVDPLPYGLLFERFLNPDRVSMPDFDIDFCMNRRDEVIDYVTEKYGEDNVGQIVTMHQLKARGVTRDVARVMGFSYGEADRVAKLIPEGVQGRTVTLSEALAQEPRLRALADGDARVADLLEIASGLEGLNRHAGTHAAGIVIGEKPLWEYVPCFRGPNGEIITQFAKTEVEEAGLVKFDFLGLKTLSVIDHAERLIRKGAENFRVGECALDDRTTFEMVQAGATTGVFQLESSGFKELLKRLKPDCFEDIVAAVALYRPGPLEGGMVDDFIDRKHGRKQVDYLHPMLESILQETYGVIVYQEQVMQIAATLAGYSLGQADLLRRAMGKKKPEEMEEQRRVFLSGAERAKVAPALAVRIFDLMEKFAGYGFNKSHSVAYALISYQTAYLKCHYPAQFMAAILTCDQDNNDALKRYIAEARKVAIEVLRPDIWESDSDFSVVTRNDREYIRFGLGAVRNVGAASVEAIVDARADEKPFSGLFDFCERVDGRKLNKRVLEALIKSGAFDTAIAEQNASRAQFFCAIDAAHDRALAVQRDRDSGQTSMFSLLDGSGAHEKRSDEAYAQQSDTQAAGAEAYPQVEEWVPRQVLAYERESLGFYVSGHPLDRYQDDLRRHGVTGMIGLRDLPDRSEVRVAGMIAGYRERPLKSGKGRIAMFTLEDQQGQVDVICFSKVFEEFESVLKVDEPQLISGRLRFEGEGESLTPRVQMTAAMTLAELRSKKTEEMHLRLAVDRVDIERLAALKDLFRSHVGDCATWVHLLQFAHSETILKLSERFSVNPSDDLIVKIEQLLGENVVSLR